MYQVYFTKSAYKDIEKLKAAGLSEKAKKLVDIIKENPFQSPPPYEKLRGELSDFYSRRINYKHRLVYRVNEATHEIVIAAMWTHYESM